jgi:uncharacterized LabA/DUF88 family protein
MPTSSSNRTSFFVDGFNLYHSLIEASRDLGGRPAKWLDIRSLLSSYLPVIGGGATLEKIYYFSALATHMDNRRPGTTTRHRLFLECLQASGIRVELGRFKKKDVHCSRCNTIKPHYEEKETDVAISVRLLEVLHRDAADTAVLVTGDTDLAPAVRTAQKLFPGKEICFAFPYKRRNSELAKLVSKHFYIRKERYLQHRLSDPCALPSGRQVSKPQGW